MESLGFTIAVHHDLARKFKVSTQSLDSRATPAFVGGTYEGRAKLDVGAVAFEVIALDLDLMIRENEALDRGGVRILRRAFSDTVPEFPALMVTSPEKSFVSFWPDQPLVIGRARGAGVRLDVPTVSLQHARIGFESGQFWVEDLGSTNGTFVGDKQVSSRISVDPGTPIWISKNACVVGVTATEQLSAADSPNSASSKPSSASQESIYPVLVSLAEVARPSRVVLKAGAALDIGRDPGCGMWLGAPHISRRHCGIEVSKAGAVRIVDSSTNGTSFDEGVLRDSQSFETSNKPIVLDFGGGVTVGLCFNADQEKLFKEAGGDPFVFKYGAPERGGDAKTLSRNRPVRERRTTTWFNMDPKAIEQFRAKRGLLPRLRAISSGLTGPGRVAMLVVAAGFVSLLVLMGSMIVSGLRW
jgi:pSer/pThr/pTyr-binding forkhead associated (FHA) protein